MMLILPEIVAATSDARAQLCLVLCICRRGCNYGLYSRAVVFESGLYLMVLSNSHVCVLNRDIKLNSRPVIS